MNPRQILLLLAGLVLLGGGLLLLTTKTWFLLSSAERESIHMEDARAMLREADEYLREHNKDSARQAAEIFNRVLSRNINDEINHLAAYGRGVALEETGDRAAALETFRELKLKEVADRDLANKVDYSLGRILLYINHQEEGDSLLDRLLAENIDDELRSRIHTAYGNFYLRRGEYERAAENFRVALKYDAENLVAEKGRAHAKKRAGKIWISYDYYDTYLTGNANLEPEEQRAVKKDLTRDAYNRGVDAYRAGRHSDAVSYFRRALNEGVDAHTQERALFWMAESYAAVGNTSQAMRTYERVLQTRNTDLDQAALVKRGVLFYRMNKPIEAAQSFQRAIEGYPSGPYTEKAIEWKREMDAQIREESIQDDMQSEDYLYPENRRENNADSAGEEGGQSNAAEPPGEAGDAQGEAIPGDAKGVDSADSAEQQAEDEAGDELSASGDAVAKQS